MMCRLKTLVIVAALPWVIAAASHAQYRVETHPVGALSEVPPGVVTAEKVKKAIAEYVDARSRESSGLFLIEDPVLKKKYRLKLVSLNDPVSKFHTGGQVVYFACVMFKAEEGNDLLDVDFWVIEKEGRLEVDTTKIHRINREPRFTYQGVNVTPLQ
jgi:hypothetical protein